MVQYTYLATPHVSDPTLKAAFNCCSNGIASVRTMPEEKELLTHEEAFLLLNLNLDLPSPAATWFQTTFRDS